MNRQNSIKYKNEIHNLIPGGAHTYSKGDDQFPENAPAAIAYGKGAYVWDLDDNMFLDCSMGLSSVSLGHAFEPVLNEVKAELDLGVNFQRPSYIERDMAECFLDLVMPHDRIKFAKNGSTVTTAAIKLARAKTNRKLVAFPSDHPFYSYDDWFIGKTLCNNGVPEEISALSVTFDSCDINSLKGLFEKYPDQIAAVITEPEKPHCYNCSCEISSKEYLEKAIALTHENGALFILDEMVTGFKVGFPGAVSAYNLTPDFITWGKGIANGFSFCALTGKKELMDQGGIINQGQKRVFLISSTHGGETHAIRAGLKTISVFKKENVLGYIHNVGKQLIHDTVNLIKLNQLEDFIDVTPCPWAILFIFKDGKKKICNVHRTFFLQEMISQNILFQGYFIPCFSHGKDEIELFLSAFDNVLKLYKSVIKNGYKGELVGAQTKSVFRKYN